MQNTTEIVVLHSIPGAWLPLTENWIWEQIRRSSLPFEVIADTFLSDSPHIDGLQTRDRNQSVVTRRMEKITTRFFDCDLNILRRRAARKLSAAHKDVIVFSHFGFQGFSDLAIEKKCHITRFYGFDLHQYPRKFPKWADRYRRLFESCDLFLVEGHYMKKTLCEIGCPENKIRVHNLGTDITGIPARERGSEANTFNILLAGAFREKKGFVYALEAIGQVIKDKMQRPVRVHIVGDAGIWQDAIEYKQRMLSIIDEFQIGSQIEFHGFVNRNKLVNIAAMCDVGIFPSVWGKDGDCEGGYPVTILDVMATGLPVIASTHCDIPEVVNNENGILCREANVEDIYNAIDLLVNQPDLLKSKSKSARLSIETRFSWGILGPQLDNIYKGLLCEKKL